MRFGGAEPIARVQRVSDPRSALPQLDAAADSAEPDAAGKKLLREKI